MAIITDNGQIMTWIYSGAWTELQVNLIHPDIRTNIELANYLTQILVYHDIRKTITINRVRQRRCVQFGLQPRGSRPDSRLQLQPRREQ